MARFGDWNAKNLELLSESQRLYNGGPSLYAVEYQRKFCCVVNQREIRPMQGWYYQVSTGNSWHVECVTMEGGAHERIHSN